MKKYTHTLKKLACAAVACLSLLGCNQTSQTAAGVQQDNNQNPKISVQLWSVKNEVKKDIKSTLTELSSMGFQGVEFAGEFGQFTNNPQGLKQFLDSLNLQVSGAHVHFSSFNDENFAATVDFYKTLGCDMLIIPYDERSFSDSGIEWVVAELNRLATKLAPLGMKIGFHNHANEFNAYKSSTYWDYIAQNTAQNVVLQQDVGWTTYSGNDPVAYVRKYPGRTLTTHYKVRLPEGTVGKLPIIGQDTIDWPNLIKANKEVGGTLWLVVEQEEYPNGLTPLQAVAESKKGLDSFL